MLIFCYAYLFNAHFAVVLCIPVVCICSRCTLPYCLLQCTNRTYGPLLTAVYAGITLFRRSELETACEGFSNIIGTLPGYTVYKGTLPCGAEIAVVSTTVAYAGGWSAIAEAHYMNKVCRWFFCSISFPNFRYWVLSMVTLCISRLEPCRR